jgi:hypothetical protein
MAVMGMIVMTNKIVLVTNDFGGREALYLNGAIIIQNNPMPRFEVTETMTNNQPFDFKEVEVSGDWLDNVNRYPEKLEDIPADVFTS